MKIAVVDSMARQRLAVETGQGVVYVNFVVVEGYDAIDAVINTEGYEVRFRIEPALRLMITEGKGA